MMMKVGWWVRGTSFLTRLLYSARRTLELFAVQISESFAQCTNAARLNIVPTSSSLMRAMGVSDSSRAPTSPIRASAFYTAYCTSFVPWIDTGRAGWSWKPGRIPADLPTRLCPSHNNAMGASCTVLHREELSNPIGQGGLA